MPLRDMRSNLTQQLAFYAQVTGTATVNGLIVDTAHYDGGVMFSFAANPYFNGTFTPLIEESDDSGMAGATEVPDSSLIGTEAGSALVPPNAPTDQGDPLTTLGIISTKRYVRVSIVPTGGGGQDATITVIATKLPEILPAI